MDMLLEIPYHTPEKKPTLLQWLKSWKSEKLKVKYHVVKIWFPWKFPTLTIETEDFRVLVDESSPMFDSLKALTEKVTSEDIPIAVVVNPDRDGGFGITTSGEKGKWNEIGTTSGFEFVQEVKKTRSK